MTPPLPTTPTLLLPLLAMSLAALCVSASEDTADLRRLMGQNDTDANPPPRAAQTRPPEHREPPPPPASADREQIPPQLLEMRAALKQEQSDFRSEELRRMRLERERTALAAEMADLDARRMANQEGREHEAELKRARESKLVEARNSLPVLENHVAKLYQDNKRVEEDVRARKLEYDNLTREYNDLVAKLVEHPGLEHWLDRRMHNLSPVLRKALVKTGKAVAPVFKEFHKVAQANERLNRRVTNRVDHVLHIKDSPFYSGILFYLILLFPLVVIVSVIQRIRERVGNVTVTHCLLMINFYFGLLFLVCFLMSVVSWRDILVVFRHRNHDVFDSFIVLHSLVFLLHAGLHLLLFFGQRGAKEGAECVALFLCGAHFYQHAFRSAMLDEPPSTGIIVFLFYALIFGLIAMEKGMVRRDSISERVGPRAGTLTVMSPAKILVEQLYGAEPALPVTVPSESEGVATKDR